tara:strand:- start:127 stop:516 length:390 start_codon:yes stop_codon:yes gene_type:complete
MASDTRIPTKSPNPKITKTYIASTAKDIAKELGMTKAQVMAVIETLPLYIAKNLAKKKLVIFDHFGSFRPMFYSTNGACNATYRIKFQPSETVRKMMRQLALKEKPSIKEGNKPKSPTPLRQLLSQKKD